MSKASVYPVVLLLLSVSGCQTLGSSVSLGSKTAKFSVEIISEPSGAKVEINDNYIGKTPLVIELEGWKSTRTFARSHTIVAHPVSAGGYTQVKVFTGWGEPDYTYGKVIPEKIYFNMNLAPVPEKIDLNIN